MIIIKVDGDIEKALKKYKKKFERLKILRELRSRKEYVKPSVKRRQKVKKAIYVKRKFKNEG